MLVRSMAFHFLCMRARRSVCAARMFLRYCALVALLVATLNTNVAANVVSPSNDFSNLNRRLISFRTGGFITGVFGILMMPWKLLGSFQSYIFGWLVGYSALLGPIAGIMIVDYFVVRKWTLDLDGLYRRHGPYEYSNGVNARAIVALVSGIAVALLGLAEPELRWLYSYAWFAGFAFAGVIYLALMRSVPVMEPTNALLGEEV